MPVRINATYLTTEEVAHMLNINERTVRKHLAAWRESGGQEGIPGGFKIGSDWRVDRPTLEAWVKAQVEIGIQRPEERPAEAIGSLRHARTYRP